MTIFLALAAVTMAPQETPLPVHVGGRVIRDREGRFGFGWPGVYFEGRFRGSAVRVRFEAPAEHMRLLIDGEEKLVFRRADRVDLLLDRLPQGEHSIRLEKLTESQQGGGRFLGFLAPAGVRPLPPVPRARQIEFIGDSYTVGYGNTSPTRQCTKREVHDTTDTQQAFGALVGRHFDADYRINAFSGFGIVRNYNGAQPGLNLPTIYQRLKPDDPAQLDAADPGWRPQLVVINLGTNDFSTALNPGEPWRDRRQLEAAYRTAYADFVRRLHARQPQARFILMGSDAFFPQVEQVAATLSAGLPGRVTTVRFEGLDLGACDWHPSLADNRRLAALLIEPAATVWTLRER
jgi:lysophospholipase L1-like esterase